MRTCCCIFAAGENRLSVTPFWLEAESRGILRVDFSSPLAFLGSSLEETRN